jgi:hypothetical protein
MSQSIERMNESIAPTMYASLQFLHGEKGATGVPVEIVRVASVVSL